MKHLDKTIDAAYQELKDKVNKLVQQDASSNYGETDEHVRQLEERLQEMRVQFEEVNTRKQWVEARLHELETNTSQF